MLPLVPPGEAIEAKHEIKQSSRDVINDLSMQSYGAMTNTTIPLTLHGIQSSRRTIKSGSHKGAILTTIAFKR